MPRKPSPPVRSAATRPFPVSSPPPAKSWFGGLALPDLAICVGLFLAVFLVYGQVAHFEFVNYDDPDYVTENDLVRNGLTVDSIKGAFSSHDVVNWIPMTVLSHIADVQLFGLESGAHHMVNVLLHALSALLLFGALHRATHNRWPSAFVAAIFALHPVHVESVAWIAERKDVLCAFCGFLALYAYVRYTERPGVRSYLTVAVFFCFGLMSKPILVTLPFLLLLLDIWPLRRAQFPRVIWEKLPLVALSAAASVVTYLTQGNAKQTAIPIAFRLRSALESNVVYIAQLFWPSKLAVFYPYHAVAVWQAAIYAVILIGISALVIYRRQMQPYLLTGWFWFLGTLVPVIGIVQVGAQARADRYTYLPMIGLTIMLAWGAIDLVKKWPSGRTFVASLAAASFIACMALSARQAAYWQNSGTLFQHAIDVTHDNYVAQNGLAIYLIHSGRAAEALPHLEESLRLIPNDSVMHNTAGIVYAGLPDHLQQAIDHFEAAVRLHPDYMEAQYNLGMTLSGIPGRKAEAIAHLEAAQGIQPRPATQQAIERLRASQ